MWGFIPRTAKLNWEGKYPQIGENVLPSSSLTRSAFIHLEEKKYYHWVKMLLLYFSICMRRNMLFQSTHPPLFFKLKYTHLHKGPAQHCTILLWAYYRVWSTGGLSMLFLCMWGALKTFPVQPMSCRDKRRVSLMTSFMLMRGNALHDEAELKQSVALNILLAEPNLYQGHSRATISSNYVCAIC